MKYSWLIIPLAAVAGLAAGFGITASEFWSAREYFDTGGLLTSGAATSVEMPSSRVATPLGVGGKAHVVGEARYDFGSMPLNGTGQHEFILKNIGTTPLSIDVEGTTCKCTLADLVDKQLAPGQETKVLLEWEAKHYSDHFEQTAELRTSDPDRPIVRLSIVGEVVAPVRADPPEIAFKSIAVDKDTTGEVRLYSFTDDAPLAISGHTLLNPEFKEHFHVQILPMPDDVLASQQGAKSGQLLSVTIKPGLPLGPIRQTIRLDTNAASLPSLEVPLRGSVASDISLMHARGARRFSDEQNMLWLGTLRSSDQTQVRMYFLVKGEYRADTTIAVDKVDPEGILQVELQQPEKLNDGAVVRVPLLITIPPGAPPVNRIAGGGRGPGMIVFRTTHPVAKELRLYVQFAIEQ